MANNRLYLCCPKCKAKIMLGKNFGGPYNIRVTIDDISDFLSEHRWCYDNNDKGVFLCEEIGSGDTMTGVELPDEY